MSYYEPAIEYLATSRTMQRLTEVVKSSTKEKVSYVLFVDQPESLFTIPSLFLFVLFVLDH